MYFLKRCTEYRYGTGTVGLIVNVVCVVNNDNKQRCFVGDYRQQQQQSLHHNNMVVVHNHVIAIKRIHVIPLVGNANKPINKEVKQVLEMVEEHGGKVPSIVLIP